MRGQTTPNDHNIGKVSGSKMGTPGENGYSCFSSTSILGALFLRAIYCRGGSQEID